MNEELQQALAQLINKSVAGVDAATEFVLAEIPDVLYQLLLWHATLSGVKTIVGIAVLVITVLAFKWLYKKLIKAATNSHTGEIDEFVCFPVALIGMGAVIFVTIGVRLINLTWLQIWIAPKVWLIEYAAQLMK